MDPAWLWNRFASAMAGTAKRWPQKAGLRVKSLAASTEHPVRSTRHCGRMTDKPEVMLAEPFGPSLPVGRPLSSSQGRFCQGVHVVITVQKVNFKPNWIIRGLLLVEMMRPKLPAFWTCPDVGSIRPAEATRAFRLLMGLAKFG